MGKGKRNMNYYVIAYDRSAGVTIALESFPEADEAVARDYRFTLELKYRHLGKNVEVVLLRAEDVASLSTTHSRYFEDSEHLRDAAMREAVPA